VEFETLRRKEAVAVLLGLSFLHKEAVLMATSASGLQPVAPTGGIPPLAAGVPSATALSAYPQVVTILKYMSTERQVADLLTKSLAKIAFERLRDDLTGYSCYNSPGNNIHALCIRITNIRHDNQSKGLRLTPTVQGK